MNTLVCACAFSNSGGFGRSETSVSALRVHGASHDASKPAEKPCTMSDLDYTKGRWVKRPGWMKELHAASQKFRKDSANWQADLFFQGSVSEVIAGYHCPRNSIYDIYRDTWFCSRKQYGFDGITSRFSSRAKWKNWTQYSEDTAHEDQRITSYLSWKWQPHTCSLQPFDAAQFVKAMGDRRIFMIGDSLTDQVVLNRRLVLYTNLQYN